MATKLDIIVRPLDDGEFEVVTGGDIYHRFNGQPHGRTVSAGERVSAAEVCEWSEYGAAVWTEWAGQQRPDIGSSDVELKFRDGLTSDGKTYPADIISWNHLGERDDIIAYRVVSA